METPESKPPKPPDGSSAPNKPTVEPMMPVGPRARTQLPVLPDGNIEVFGGPTLRPAPPVGSFGRREDISLLPDQNLRQAFEHLEKLPSDPRRKQEAFGRVRLLALASFDAQILGSPDLAATVKANRELLACFREALRTAQTATECKAAIRGGYPFYLARYVELLEKIVMEIRLDRQLDRQGEEE